MAECLPPGVSGTTANKRNKSRSFSLLDRDISSVLEITSMPLLEPASTEKDKELKLRKDCEAENYSKNQNNASAVTPARRTPYSGRRYQSPPPHRNRLELAATARVKRLYSQATISAEFPKLATTKHNFSSPFPTVLQSHGQNILYIHFMPALEYLHRCMPVSFYLKGSPNAAKDSLKASKVFQHTHFALPSPCKERLPSRHSLQLSRRQRKREVRSELHKKMQTPSSPTKSHSTIKTVKKTPRKLIPIATLSVKGFPKV